MIASSRRVPLALLEEAAVRARKDCESENGCDVEISGQSPAAGLRSVPDSGMGMNSWLEAMALTLPAGVWFSPLAVRISSTKLPDIAGCSRVGTVNESSKFPGMWEFVAIKSVLGPRSKRTFSATANVLLSSLSRRLVVLPTLATSESVYILASVTVVVATARWPLLLMAAVVVGSSPLSAVVRGWELRELTGSKEGADAISPWVPVCVCVCVHVRVHVCVCCHVLLS